MQGMLGRAKPFIIIVPEAALTYQQINAIVIDIPSPSVTVLRANVFIIDTAPFRATFLSAHVIVTPAFDFVTTTFLQASIVVYVQADTLNTTFLRANALVAPAFDTAANTFLRATTIIAPAFDMAAGTFLRANVVSITADNTALVTQTETRIVCSEQFDVKKVTALQSTCVIIAQREPVLEIVEQSPSPIDVIDGAVNFYVVAELLGDESAEIFYQWEARTPVSETFEQILGATNSTLNVVNLIAEDNNTEYRCRAYTTETTLLSAASVYSDTFRITLYRNNVTTLVADVLTCDPPVPVFDVSSFTLDIVTHIPPPVGQTISCVIADTLTFRGLSPTQRLTNLDLDILTRGLQNRVRLTGVVVDVLTYTEPPPPTTEQAISGIIVDTLAFRAAAPIPRLTTLSLEILTYNIPYNS